MSKCRYCHKHIWPWQSYFSQPEQERTDEYIILIIPDYDRHIHESCHLDFLSEQDLRIDLRVEASCTKVRPHKVML